MTCRLFWCSAVLAAFCSLGRADVLPNYSITGVPDFDQKRDAALNPFRYGLPQNDPSTCSADPCKSCTTDEECNSCSTCEGDESLAPECCDNDPLCTEAFDGPCIGVGGGMYCFPTSAIDWMAYLANNGYPQVDPGPAADWQSMGVYNLIGEKIFEMGVLMNTNPSGGTQGEPAQAGIEAWLAPHAPLFSVTRFAREGKFAPRLETLAKAGLSGQLVIAGVGYYKRFIPIPLAHGLDSENAQRSQGVEWWFRSGGHLMPFVGASFAGNPLVRTFEYHNPASSDSTIEQSSFSPGSTPLTAVTANFKDSDDGFFVRTQDQLDEWNTGNPDKATFLDAYTAIVPFGLITGTSVGDPPGVKRLNPVPVPPTNLPAEETYPFGNAVIDGAFSPTYTDAFVITEAPPTGGANQLWLLDLVTEEATEIVPPVGFEPGQVIAQKKPGRMILISNGRSTVRPYDLSWEPEVPLPSGALADAAAFDDANDQLLILSVSTGELLLYPADLSTSPTSVPLPAVIAPTGGVDLDVVTGPAGEEIWISDTEAGAVYRLTYGAGGGLVVSDTIPCCGITANTSAANRLPEQPEKLSLGGTGYLIVLGTSGRLIEFEPSRAGGWQPAADPLLTGMTATGFIDAVRSRTNYDPATMSGPAWRNVLPAGEPGEGPTIPAASTWGLAALALLTLTGGTLVLRKRRERPGLFAMVPVRIP